MPIALAFACAVVYGVADYCGGRATRSAPSIAISFIGQISRLVFAVVVVFAVGVLGLARVEGARENDGGTHTLGLAQAGLCFVACAAVVAYGIYLIVPQFH